MAWPARSASAIPFERDRDRLLTPAQQIQNRGQVGVHAEQIVQVAQLGGLVARLAQHPDGRLRVVAPSLGHGQGAGRVQTAPGAPPRRRAVATSNGLLGVVLGLGEDALEHAELSQCRQHSSATGGRLGRHELDGPPVGRECSVVITGGAPVAAQRLHHESKGGSLSWIVEDGRGRFGIGRGPGRLACGEGGLGRSDVQIRQARDRLIVGDDLVEAQGQLVVSQRDRTGVDRLRRGSRRQGRVLGGRQVAGGQVVGERDRRLWNSAPTPRHPREPRGSGAAWPEADPSRSPRR